MTPTIAATVYGVLIVGLFWLDRDPKARVSWASWVPVAWIVLACSRSTAQWLQLGEPIDQSNPYVLEGSPVDRAVYTGLLVIGILVLLFRIPRVKRLLFANRILVFVFLYCAISLLWSNYPEIAFKRWIKALGDLVMVLVILSERDPEAAIDQVLARIGFLLIPLSVLFIKYFPDLGKGYGKWDYKAYYTGVTTNKNTLGAICLLIGLFSLWQLIRMKDPRFRKSRRFARELLVHGTVLLMVFWLFWKADSVTSFMCFLLGAFVLLSLQLPRKKLRRGTIHALVLGTTLVPFSVLFLGIGSGLAGDVIARNFNTLTDRTDIWKLVIQVSGDTLLGTGFESFWVGPRLVTIWAKFPWHPYEAHNGYLEIYANLGWVGVLLLLIVLITSYRKILVAYRQGSSATSSLVLMYFTVGLIYNLTEAAFFRMMAPMWLFLLVALTYVASGAKDNSFIKPHRTLPAENNSVSMAKIPRTS